MAEVHIQDGETLENALRRFKRKVLQEDIIKEVKRHAFYLKPGQKKRIKSALARKRNPKKRVRDRRVRAKSISSAGFGPHQARLLWTNESIPRAAPGGCWICVRGRTTAHAPGGAAARRE